MRRVPPSPFYRWGAEAPRLHRKQMQSQCYWTLCRTKTKSGDCIHSLSLSVLSHFHKQEGWLRSEGKLYSHEPPWDSVELPSFFLLCGTTGSAWLSEVLKFPRLRTQERMLCAWPLQTQLFLFAFQIPGRSKEDQRASRPKGRGGRTKEWESGGTWRGRRDWRRRRKEPEKQVGALATTEMGHNSFNCIIPLEKSVQGINESMGQMSNRQKTRGYSSWGWRPRKSQRAKVINKGMFARAEC